MKIKKNKQAQGLALRTIVVAILVLVVLIVLIAIFTGQIDIGVRALNDCESKGGDCRYEEIGDCRSAGGVPMPHLKCKDETKKCCKIMG